MGRRPKTALPSVDDSAVQILSQQSELVPVEHLVVHPDNPNEGDLRAVMDSIRAHGFWGTVIANRRTRHVLAGNHRYLAACQLGLVSVPVSWVDVSDEMERRILLTDNRISELAKRDDAKLSELLADLQTTDDGLANTGYNDNDLDNLIRSLTKPGTLADRNKTPAEGLSDYNAAVHGREIHLAYTAEEYNKVIENLEVILVRYDASSYSEAVMRLLEDTAD